MHRFALFFSHKIDNVIRLCYEVILLFYILFSQYNSHSRVGPIGPLEIHHAEVLFFSPTPTSLSLNWLFFSHQTNSSFLFQSLIFSQQKPQPDAVLKRIFQTQFVLKIIFKMLKFISFVMEINNLFITKQIYMSNTNGQLHTYLIVICTIIWSVLTQDEWPLVNSLQMPNCYC